MDTDESLRAGIELYRRTREEQGLGRPDPAGAAEVARVLQGTSLGDRLAAQYRQSMLSREAS